MAAARAHRELLAAPGPQATLGGILAGTSPAMDQDDEPGARTPPLAGASSRKGVLRRLLDGLRGETPAARRARATPGGSAATASSTGSDRAGWASSSRPRTRASAAGSR